MKKLLVLLLCSASLLVGCKKSSSTNYNVSVAVSGLVGTGVMLQLNNLYTLEVDVNGTATFSNQLSNGTAYAVTVIKQPAVPAQTCTLNSAATGTISGANVTNITLVCSPIEFAYALNSNGASILPFVVNTTNGVITSAGSSVAAGNGPQAFAIDPTGRFAFVANYLDNTISPYLGNTTNGILVSSGPAVSTGAGSGPVAVAVDPLSKLVYAANSGNGGGVVGYSIATNGTLVCVGSGCPTTPTATTGSNPSSLVVVNLGAAGEFLYVTNAGSNTISVYSISSTQSGALSLLQTVPTGNNPTSIAVSPKMVVSGNTFGPFVYVLNSSDYTVSGYAVNANGTLTSTGAAISTGGSNPNPSGNPLTECNASNVCTGLFAFPQSIAFTPNGLNAYVVNPTSNNIAAFTISSTGQLTGNGVVSVTGNNANPTPVSVAVDPTGAFAFVANLKDNSITTFPINANGTLGTSTVQSFGNNPISIVTAAK